jgi:hypothetical protein
VVPPPHMGPERSGSTLRSLYAHKIALRVAELSSMGSRRRLGRRAPAGSAVVPCRGTGTTTLRAALAGRARSRPGRTVSVPGRRAATADAAR